MPDMKPVPRLASFYGKDGEALIADGCRCDEAAVARDHAAIATAIAPTPSVQRRSVRERGSYGRTDSCSK